MLDALISLYDDVVGCRIFTIPATLRALLMSRSSGDVCSRKFLYLCTRRLQYTAMDKTSLHTSLSPLFFNTTHSTRVFVLTTHLRGACNRDPFGCWFLMLFTHQTLFSLCVYGQSKPGGLLFASFLSTFRRTEPFSDSPHPVLHTKQHSEFGMVHRCAGFTLTL